LGEKGVDSGGEGKRGQGVFAAKKKFPTGTEHEGGGKKKQGKKEGQKFQSVRRVKKVPVDQGGRGKSLERERGIYEKWEDLSSTGRQARKGGIHV